MKIKINPITNLFHQLPQSHALRTTMMDAILAGTTVLYHTAGTTNSKRLAEFVVTEVTASWIAKSNGLNVIAVDVLDAGEPRQITMRVHRIHKINGEDADMVTLTI